MTEPVHAAPAVSFPVPEPAMPAPVSAPPMQAPAPKPDPHPGIAAANARPAAMDLDKMEREGARAPFDFVLEGKRYLMSDPQEVDWQDLLAAMTNPHMFFRLVLPPEDRIQFFNTRLPAWKMNKLVDGYQEHYGIPSLPNANGLPR